MRIRSSHSKRLVSPEIQCFPTSDQIPNRFSPTDSADEAKLKFRNLSTNIQKTANQRRGFAGSFVANIAKQICHRPEAADSISQPKAENHNVSK